MIICAPTFSDWHSDFCASDDHEDHEDHEDHGDHEDPDLGGCSGICAGDGAICSKSAHLCCL